MTGSELLSTPDAQVWAKEFCETFGGNTVNGGVVDLELMFGWFANAMEAGRMQVSSATPSPTIAAVTDEMVEAALRTYATSPHLRELEQPFSSAPGPHDSEQARHDMRLAIEAALATPSPTTPEAERCACGTMFVGIGPACESCQRVIDGATPSPTKEKE